VLKQIQEVSALFRTTADRVEIPIAQTDLERAIIGIVDGMPSEEVESETDVTQRTRHLRDFSYK
jgi:hypothetical protein